MWADHPPLKFFSVYDLPLKFFCLYNLPPPNFFRLRFTTIFPYNPTVTLFHISPNRRYQNSVGSGAWFLADKRRLSVLTPVNPIRLHVLRSALSAACLV